MISASELEKLLISENCPRIIDVRSGPEFRSAHISGALNLPLPQLPFTNALPDDRATQIVLTCEHGPRAQLAAGVLKLRGFSDIVLLSGHMQRWKRERRAVVQEDD